MIFIVELTTVKSKSWFRIFPSGKVTLIIGGTELKLSSSTEILNRILECEELTTFQMVNKRGRVEKEIKLDQELNHITIEDEEFHCSLVLRRIPSTWAYLDPQIESFGLYAGRPYYTNERTSETSFERRFLSEQSNFPSFRQRHFQDRLFFVDSINKIVISMHPSAKQNQVKESLKGMLNRKTTPSRINNVRLIIDREKLLQSGSSELLKNLRSLRASVPLFSFRNEIGEDYGAIRREFFYLVIKEMVKDPRLTESGGLYDVSPSSSLPEFVYDFSYAYESIDDVLQESDGLEDDRVFYIFMGVILGSVILFRETLPVNFSLAFYENLLGRQWTIRHIQDAEFQRSVLKCHRNDFEGESPLETPEIVDEIVMSKLLKGKMRQYDFTRLGFLAIFPDGFDNITAFDLPFIFYHFEPISIIKLMRHVHYEKCTPNTPEVMWMWEILSTKDQEYLSRFLMFFTGSGTFPRFDEEMKFSLEKVSTPGLFLTASSCARRLYIGSYGSRNEMEYFMDYSLYNSSGFHKI